MTDLKNTRLQGIAAPRRRVLHFIQKHACGGFLTTLCRLPGEPTAPRAANGDRNSLLRKGFVSAVHAARNGSAVGGPQPSNTAGGDYTFSVLAISAAMIAASAKAAQPKMKGMRGVHS